MDWPCKLFTIHRFINLRTCLLQHALVEMISLLQDTEVYITIVRYPECGQWHSRPEPEEVIENNTFQLDVKTVGMQRYRIYHSE